MTDLQDKLHSTHHLEVAHALGDVAVDLIRKQKVLGGEKVADGLQRILEESWRDHGADKRPREEQKKQRQALYDSIKESIPEEDRPKLVEALARAGHLYEIAGLHARDNFFREAEEKGSTPGMASAFIRDFARDNSTSEVIDKLNKPVFEVIMTQHPTNTNSLESIQLQRKIGIAAEHARDSAGSHRAPLEGAIEEYLHAPLLHQIEGEDQNFSVHDETRIVMNALENIYDDLPRVYHEFDRELENHAKTRGEAYDPTTLNLNIRLGSWGSGGDKDGNDSVTAETTLQAIGMHTEAIVGRYVTSLKKLCDSLPDGSDEFQMISQARTEMEHSHATLQRWNEDMEALRQKAAGNEALKGRFLIAPEEFDRMNRDLREVRDALPKMEPLQETLTAITRLDLPEDAKEEALNMLRATRMFGYRLAKIEYRETAEQYERVVNQILSPVEIKQEIGIVAPYTSLSTWQKAELLDKVIRKIEKPDGSINQEALDAIFPQAELDRIRTEGSLRTYSPPLEKVKGETAEQRSRRYFDDNALPIAYHSLKRLTLAGDHPDMIEDNVLAETKGQHNMLEAKLIQLAASRESIKERPLVGIVPLFEEPETMQAITPIMEKSYQSAAYQQHLGLLAERRGGDKTQQVQIAHSDNARRSGLQAARGFIHEAHKAMRKLHARWNDEHPDDTIGIQFFEGGSISDAYRNGTRAVSESVDAFGLHDFGKFTFQGGDLVNYFNQPTSIVRLFSRSVTHGASGMVDTLPGNGSAKSKFRTNEIADQAAIAALKRTLGDYQDKDFNADYNKMGVMMAALDYAGETKAGNRGSRAAQRSGPAKTDGKKLAFGKVDSVQLGAVLQPIAVDRIRTIGFSEAWQHNSIVPSWIGSDKLAEYLRDSLRKSVVDILERRKESGNISAEEVEFVELFGSVVREGLQPQHIARLYHRSPAFRDAQDRSAYGIALSDMDGLAFLNDAFEIDTKKDNQSVQAWKSMGREYLERMQDTYVSAAKIARAALLKDYEIDGHSGTNWSFVEKTEDPTGELRAGVTSALKRISDQIQIKDAYRDFVMMAKRDLCQAPDREDYDHLRGVLHNAGDTVVHGRVLAADDAMYGKQVAQRMHAGRSASAGE